MQENHEERKKSARKGMPHHQDELPFDVIKKPDASYAAKKEPDLSNETVSQDIPLKELKSLKEQKNRSVIRSHFLNEDKDKLKDSMVKRVVDNLLHEDKEEEINEIEKPDAEIDVPERVEEIFSEDNEQKYSTEYEAEDISSDDNERPDTSDEKDEMAHEDSENYEEMDNSIEPEEADDTEPAQLETEEEPEDSKEERAEETESAESPVNRSQLAKEYEKIHNILYIVDISVTILAILAFLFLGGSRNLRDWIYKFTENPWLVPLLYSAVLTIVYYFVILIPLHAIDYHFEKKFKLSTQSFASWLDDNFKSLVLNMILMGLFLEVTYFLLRKSPDYWWVWGAAVWTLFGVLMTNLVPILILPLFYKLTPLKDDTLRNRLRSLAERLRMKVLNVYEIKLSKKTKKANAMLAGLGNTKRIILGDTLINNYTGDEIETIIAHELGHHYHRHIPKLILLGTVLAFAGFFIAHLFLRVSIGWFDYLDIDSISDIAGFPLLMIAIFIFGILTMPISNWLTRMFERQSDKFALRLTDRPNEFISAMKKLADQNLSDKEPSPVVEFLLHDHPSISSRIAAAEDYAVRKRI